MVGKIPAHPFFEWCEEAEERGRGEKKRKDRERERAGWDRRVVANEPGRSRDESVDGEGRGAEMNISTARGWRSCHESNAAPPQPVPTMAGESWVR